MGWHVLKTNQSSSFSKTSWKVFSNYLNTTRGIFKRIIHAFLERIRVKWNASYLVQDLKSFCHVRFFSLIALSPKDKSLRYLKFRNLSTDS